MNGRRIRRSLSLARLIALNADILMVILAVMFIILAILGYIFKVNVLLNIGIGGIVTLISGLFISVLAGFVTKTTEVLIEELYEGRSYRVGELSYTIEIDPTSDKKYWDVTITEARKKLHFFGIPYTSEQLVLDIPRGRIDRCSIDFHLVGTQIKQDNITKATSGAYCPTENSLFYIKNFQDMSSNEDLTEILIKRHYPPEAEVWPDPQEQKMVLSFKMEYPVDSIIIHLQIKNDDIKRYSLECSVKAWDGRDVVFVFNEIPHREEEKRVVLKPRGQRRFYIGTWLKVIIKKV